MNYGLPKRMTTAGPNALWRGWRAARHVNSRPTNTARAELRSMITFRHANTRGSRAGELRIAHLCVPKTKCHPRVMFQSFPHLTLTTSARSLSHPSHLPLLSFRQSHQHTQNNGSRYIFTLRCSAAEWRINTNAVSHRLRAQIGRDQSHRDRSDRA